MGFHIYATLNDGRPCLRVVDAETRKTCLHWCCDCQPGTDQQAAQKEIHRLFSKLLLLSCQQELAAGNTPSASDQ